MGEREGDQLGLFQGWGKAGMGVGWVLALGSGGGDGEMRGKQDEFWRESNT